MLYLLRRYDVVNQIKTIKLWKKIVMASSFFFSAKNWKTKFFQPLTVSSYSKEIERSNEWYCYTIEKAIHEICPYFD